MPPMQTVGKMIGNMHARKLSETHAYTHTHNTQTHTWYLIINIIGHIQNIKTFI